MEPGFYKRGECPDYGSIDMVNISSLLWMAKSAKHYQACPRKQTKPLSLGTAAHCATLEPDRFESDFAVWDRYSENGNLCPRNGKHWDTFRLVHSSQEIIMPSEYSDALSIASSVRADTQAMDVLSDGDAEVTLVWQHKRTGIWCKGRVDFLSRDLRVLADLKTAADLTPGVFFSRSAKYHYHTRMAWYTDGLRAVAGMADDEPVETLIVGVESGKPHDCAVFWMDDEVLETGRNEYEDLMTKLRLATDFNDWPGIANRARIRWQLPMWAVDDPEETPDTELDWSKPQ